MESPDSPPTAAPAPSIVPGEGEERLLRILDSITDCFYAFDAEWRFTYFNEAARRILEQHVENPASLIGRNYFEAFPATVGTPIEAAFKRAVAEGVAVEFENFYEPWQQWFSHRCFPIRGGGMSLYFRDTTEEKRRQETIRASEAKYRSLFNSIDSGFCVVEMLWSEDGKPYGYRFLDVNAVFEEQTGLRDPVGRTSMELVPNLEPYWFEIYGRVARTGEPTRFVEGSEAMGRWFDVYAFPLGEGEIRPVAIFFNDITARRRADEELRHAKVSLHTLAEQRRLALDSAQMGWWQLDLATQQLLCDERFKAIFGIRQETVSYEAILKVLHPEDQDLIHRRVQAAVRPVDPVPYAAEYRVVHADGSIVWVAARGQATFAGEGENRRAVSLVGTVLDITESKQTLQTLQESERRFRQLADAMPQMVWSTLPDGFHDYYNARWYEFTGTPPGSTDGEGWNGMFHPDDQERAWARWRHCLATGEPYQIEYRLRYRDGSYRWVLGRALAVLDEQGAIVRWFGTCTDIQEQRALLEQNAQLLDSERAARAEAERTGRMKDEFLATLSHELRTPLNAILGWTQVLRGDPEQSEDTAQGLATIERNARAQNQIIEDLLDMSRIISGKVRLDVQPLELDQALRAAVDTMRPAADAKAIRLQTLIDPQARMVSGDPNRLQQVFWNLLTNAIKFTPKGGRVQVMLQRVNSHLEVSVIDSGEGIAPDFLPHVFDRFRQQDASITRRHGGLGLGLAIVKQLVELHGGTVQAESAGRDQGTTFRVSLPLRVVRSDAEENGEGRRHPQASDHSALPSPANRLNLSGVRVVVVDDEADARFLVKRLLGDCGASVRAAGSAAEALELIAAEKPDVLVSDIGMPGEDGFSLIRRLRALPPEQGGSVPAVALTAYARSEDRLKVILAGFQTHMAKPVEAAELLALVASLAGRVTGQEETPDSGKI